MSLIKSFILWIASLAIILLIAYIFAVSLERLQFSEDTLLWMTSTIAQAFGAMLAIILAVSLYQRDKIREENLWPRLYLPIQSIAALIVVSLFVLMIIKSNIVLGNSTVSLIFFFLFFYSAFNIELVILEISKTFRMQK